MDLSSKKTYCCGLVLDRSWDAAHNLAALAAIDGVSGMANASTKQEPAPTSVGFESAEQTSTYRRR